MKIIPTSRILFLTLIFTYGAMISSCKKEVKKTPEPPKTGLSDADSLKYLMYRTMQVSFVDGGRDKTYQLPTYYWYKQVPELDPLSAQYDSADVLLKKMKTFPKGPDGKLIDKYSFLDNGQVAGEIQQGVAGDLGMEVTFARNGAGSNDIILVVLHTDKNGPAGNAGVKRGYLVTKINGANVVYDNNGPGVQNVINAIYRDEQSTFTFKKQDGTSFTKVLSRAVYPINPVLFDSIYTVAGKKIGYFVFNTFSNIENKNGSTLTKSELDRVFTTFQGAGISSLIVDFRYNGGGSVNTADYITSKIAPQSANGKVMYKYKYNDKLTGMASQIGLQEQVLFKNAGNMNLENVFFISGDKTASASELVMNNLKPYMNVRIVGDTTYGKPVGFFSFTISIFKNGVEKDLADLYAINFETVNSAGEGGFYHGIAPNALAADFVGEPWGGAKDENLIKIFNYISTGSYGRLSSMERMSKDKTLQMPVESAIKPLRFNGMVDYKIGEVIKKEFNRSLGR
ncbi:MAG: S41 family peptidase [Ginsengibacter sp.]